MIQLEKPNQRLSYRSKVANGNEWGKENGRYWISCANFASYGSIRFANSPSSSERDVKMLYDLYNSKFPSSWFHYIVNPLNTNKSEYQNQPAKIRPYNILRSNIDLFVGEYLQRPKNWMVYVEGEEGYNAYLESLDQQLRGNLEQIIINTLNEEGIDTGQPSKPVNDLNQLKQEHDTTFKDQMAIVAQQELDLAIADQEIYQKAIKMFFDWLIAGACFSYKGVRFNSVVYDRVSPLHIWYSKSEESDYIEDAEAVVRRMFLTPSDVLDMFYEEITKQDLEDLDKGGNLFSSSFIATTFLSSLSNKDSAGKIEVLHFTWKTQKEIHSLHYYDEYGREQEEEVDGSYKPNQKEGEWLESIWVNEIWEGYQVDGDKWFGLGPCLIQRNDMNNRSKCKQPYNGRLFSDIHSENISIAELGVPNQILFVAVNFKIEKEINKSKGKIVLMDKNVIPRGGDWDEDKFFYFSDVMGWALMDRNQIGVDKSMNQYTVLDLSTFDHIAKLIEIKDDIKADWDEMLGISRQRKSNITQNDSVGGSQMAIFQSNTISEIVFTKFEEFMTRDLQGVLDCTKFANLNGKRAAYINDDRKLVIHNLIPEEYCTRNYGLFVANNSKETKKLGLYRQQANALAQRSDVNPLAILEIATGENTAKIKESIAKLYAEDQRRLAEQAQQENKMQAQAQQEAIELQNQYALIEKSMEESLLNLKYDREEGLAYVKAEAEAMKGTDGDGDGIPDLSEIVKNANDRKKIALEENRDRVQAILKRQELALKKKDIDNKDRQHKEEMRVALKEQETQVKVARLKPKPTTKK